MRHFIAAAIIVAATIAGTTATSGLVLADGSGQGHCASATTQNSSCASHGGGVLADGNSSTGGASGSGVSNSAQNGPQPH
jgi:hypothetical protein